MLFRLSTNIRLFRFFRNGLFFVFCLVAFRTAAQVSVGSGTAATLHLPGADTVTNTAAKWYEKQTIFLVGGNTFAKNGTTFTGRKALLKEFSISPAGMKLYVRSRKIRNFTMTLSLAGAVGTIFATTSKNRDNLRGLMWTSIGVGIVSSWGTAYANSVRDRAFWTRNHDAMLKFNAQD